MPVTSILTTESTIRRIALGSVRTVAGTGVASAATLLASVICTRYLGLEGFGRVSALNSTIGVCALFGVLGMGMTATRFIAQTRDSEPARVGRIIALFECLTGLSCVTASIGLVWGSAWLAKAFFHDPLLSPYLRLGVLWLAGFVYNEIAISVLAGFEAFMPIAIGQLLRGSVLLTTTWVGLHFWGPLGAVWALIASVSVPAVFLRFQIQRQLRARKIRRDYRGILSELHLIWSYSIPAVLTGIVFLPFVFSANGIIARHLGIRELGLVSAVVQWRGTLTFLPVNLSKVALATLASRLPQEESESHRFEVSNWFNQVLLWPVALFLLFAARRILSLNGHDFVSGVSALQVMIGGTALGYVGNVFVTVIQAQGWFKIGIAANLLTGLSIGFCTWALVGNLRAEAMSWGYFVGYALNFVLSGYLVTRRMGLPPQLWMKMRIAALAMVGALVVAHGLKGECSWGVAGLISLLGMIFAAVLFAPTSITTRWRSTYALRSKTSPSISPLHKGVPQ